MTRPVRWTKKKTKIPNQPPLLKTLSLNQLTNSLRRDEIQLMKTATTFVPDSLQRNQLAVALIAQREEPTLVLSFRELRTVNGGQITHAQPRQRNIHCIFLVGMHFQPLISSYWLHDGSVNVQLLVALTSDFDLNVDRWHIT